MAKQASVHQGEAPLHVDSDLLRGYHPEYVRLARTDPEQAFRISQPQASRWADGLRDAAIARRLDLVIEGLFKTSANTRRLCEALNAQGYEVRVSVKLLPAVLSLLQIERRFERQTAGTSVREIAPRRVDAAAHAVGYDAVVPMLDLVEGAGLVAGVDLYDGRLDRVYASPSTGPDGGATAFVRRACGTGLTGTEEREARWLAEEVLSCRRARGAPVEPEAGSALEAALALLMAD